MVLLLSASLALAVEGMWEPAQLRSLSAELRAAGYPDDPGALSNLHAAPLGAIVNIGGCTASFVSDLGLLVTNHHCVIGMLQRAQKPGEDLVQTGFYAPTRADERSAGRVSRVYITEGYEDVTARVHAALAAARDDRARTDAMDDVSRKLVADCEKPGGKRCRVVKYFEGLRYTLVRQSEIRDLRVVMAPPDMVGNYGDEIDNWHWPRHSGDFAFLRAYVGRDGRPADPSPDNVPYTPPHRLGISSRGVAPGEFVMLAGYPGHTERWRTAIELRREAELRLPDWIAEATWRFDLLTATMREDAAASPLLADRRSGLGNGLFNAKGTLEGFRRARVPDAADARDARVDAWVAADPARQARLAPAIAELRASLAEDDAERVRDSRMDWLGGSDHLAVARQLYRWSLERQKPDARREPGYQERDRARALAGLTELQSHLHVATEAAVFGRALRAVLALPADQRPAELLAWLRRTTPGAADDEALAAGAVAALFASPLLSDPQARLAWMEKPPAAFAAATDPFLSLAVALRPFDEAREERTKRRRGLELRTRPAFAEALRASDPAHAYSDANGTLRVSFGTVQGLSPQDGVVHTPQTTVRGIVEKAGEWPFAAPQPLVDAITRGAWGSWADPRLGTVPVAFLSDLDITGGNSGSPILDARGRLVGLAFDGNYEGIASDWFYDGRVARTIGVDVRYVLWYLDAVAGADSLLAEMGITGTI